MNLLVKIGILGLTISMLGTAQDFSAAVGHWEFDDSNNLLKATKGSDLQLQGTHSAVAGPENNDGAVRIGVGSYYRALHGIAANGTGTSVNEYSIVVDFKAPSIGQYYTFYQSDITNADDGEIFINTSGKIGISAVTYSSGSVVAGDWNRLVISVDNGSTFNFYLNGSLYHTGTAQSVDSRFALSASPDPVLLFADENAEDNEFDVALVAIYDKTLSAAEATALGGYTKPLTTSRYEGKPNNWWKGNSHSHPNAQIGINATAQMYHDNNFDYLVLTEHRSWLSNADVSITPRRNSFLIIQGEEFHSNLSNGNKHTSVLNSDQQAGDLSKSHPNKWEFYNEVYTLITAAGGFPIMNHPTWGGLVTADDFSKIQGFQHFELMNGAQDTDSYGIYGTGMPHVEDLWDQILTAGGKWYGVGADDFHRSTPKPEASNPFTAWTMLKTSELSVDSVLEAYRVGRFYASNGVILNDLTTDFGLYKISVDTASTLYELSERDQAGWSNSARPVTTGTPGYRIDFIGENGTVLKTVNGLSGEYQATQNDTYVRGRVTYLRNIPPNGAPYDNNLDQAKFVADNNITREEYYAWGQPFFTDVRHEGGIPKFGCTDNSFLEYDAAANISDPAECLTNNVYIKQLDRNSFEIGNGFKINVGPEFGRYSIEIRTLNGVLHKQIASNSSRTHIFDDLVQYKTYIVLIRGVGKKAFKKIQIR